MHQETSSPTDIEKSQESKHEKIREVTIVEPVPKSKLTGKIIFGIFLIGVLVGDTITYFMHAGTLYDKLFASVIMLFTGVIAGTLVWASRKYLFKK